MPFTIEGIGTFYFGSSDEYNYRGYCSKCKTRVRLSDYNTRLWFVIGFLPVIPLGKKRVLHFCDFCESHTAQKLSTWEDQVQVELLEKIACQKHHPHDAQANLDMLDALSLAGKREEARSLADILQRKFIADADSMMQLSKWYDTHGMNFIAMFCMEQAYGLDKHNLEACRAKAVQLLQKGEIEEAKPILEKFKHGSDNYDPSLMALLADAYQNAEDHEAAARVHESILANFPEAAQNKHFRNAVKKSSQTLGTSLPTMQSPPVNKHPAFKYVAALALLVLLYGSWVFYLKNNRTIHIVNGMAQPILVEIDETRIEIPALTRITSTVAEGDHQAELISPKIAATKPFRFTITPGFWELPFDKSVTVLDPSESALIQKVTLKYDKERLARNEQQEFRDEIQGCQPVYQYEEIDHPFERFAADWTVDEGTERIRLNFLEINEQTSSFLLTLLKDKQLTHTYTKRHIDLKEETDDLVRFFTTTCITNEEQLECKQVLQDLIRKDPENVVYHECLLFIGGWLNQIDELTQYYDSLIEAYPDTALYLYLRGYLYWKMSDVSTQWQKTLALAPHHPEANLSLAKLEYYRENYEQSLSYLKEVHKTGDEDQIKEATSLSLACYHELNQLQQIQKLVSDQERDHWHFIIRSCFIRNEPGEARWMIDRIRHKVKLENPMRLSQFNQFADCFMAYYQQDFDQALEYFRPSVMNRYDSWEKLELLLLTNNLKQAEDILPNLDRDEKLLAQCLLSMYCLYQGDQQQADVWLQHALEHLENGNRNERYCAELFKQKHLTYEELSDLYLINQDRHIIFTIFALKHQHLKDQITDHLARTEINLAFGFQLVNTVLSKEISYADSVQPE